MASKTKSSLVVDQLSDRSPSFPSTHQLVITTTKGVYSWDDGGIAILFRSGSGGIVAARKANDGSGMLAVADGRVVVLHDLNRGMHKRSYRLRGSDVSFLDFGMGERMLMAL